MKTSILNNFNTRVDKLYHSIHERSTSLFFLPKKGYIFFLVFFIFFTSCCPKYRPELTIQTKIDTLTQIVTKDTFITLTDYSSLQLLLECDSLNNVVMKELSATSGKYIEVPRYIYKDKIITIDCEIDSAEIMFKYNETHKIIKNEIIVEKQYIKEKGMKVHHWFILAVIVFTLLYFAIKK
jgi:hypothetical protein